jgi:hypothetical protein
MFVTITTITAMLATTTVLLQSIRCGRNKWQVAFSLTTKEIKKQIIA